MLVLAPVASTGGVDLLFVDQQNATGALKFLRRRRSCQGRLP